jgi:hypothetical protein
LRTISLAQKEWADAVGTNIGLAKLTNATELDSEIRAVVSTDGRPGTAG